MPSKQYRFKKRQRCPVNQTELTSVKDARISLLTESRLGSKLNVCDVTWKILVLKLTHVYKYVEMPIAVKNDRYKTLIGRTHRKTT